MRSLLLIRHGETEWNVAGRWQGWEDVPLTAEGEAQALERARWLAAGSIRFDLVCASDLRRAALTAQIIADHLGLDPPVLDERLRERHGGAWQGNTRAQIDERYPGTREAWRLGELQAPPGGERDDSLLERVDAAIASMCSAVDDGGCVLVVSHLGVLRAVSARAGVPPVSLIPNVGGRWFTWSSDEITAGAALPPLAAPPEETPATE